MKINQPLWITILLYWFGATYALNGIAMLFFPSAWFFRLVPGVPETGAFNAHLVMDGGTFYIPIGVALIVAARDTKRHISAIAIAAGATVLHALLHLYSHEAALLSWDHVVTELVWIYLPAALLTVISLLVIARPISGAFPEARLSPTVQG